jgi:hypothetical protein
MSLVLFGHDRQIKSLIPLKILKNKLASQGFFFGLPTTSQSIVIFHLKNGQEQQQREQQHFHAKEEWWPAYW